MIRLLRYYTKSMPNKRVHDWVLVGVAGGIVASGPLAGPLVIPAAVGVLTGLAISPDLDLADQRPGTLWNRYWWVYSMLITHRHPLSHMPGISTMVRLVYLPIIPLFAWLTLAGHVSELGWWIFRWWFIGLCLADLVHVALDITVSYWRKI